MPSPPVRRSSRRHSDVPAQRVPAQRPQADSRTPSRRQTVVILSVFASVFVGLASYTVHRTSATWDEPMHLAAGHAALAQGDFRLDPSHPPLLRMWAALPTLALPHRALRPLSTTEVSGSTWLQGAYLLAHRFVYLDNDADRLLGAARLMIIGLGVLLGAWLFLWARAWLGLGPAVLALAAYTFEPNVLAHASLATTDLGVSCLMFGTVYFLWRLSHGVTRGALVGLLLCTWDGRRRKILGRVARSGSRAAAWSGGPLPSHRRTGRHRYRLGVCRRRIPGDLGRLRLPARAGDRRSCAVAAEPGRNAANRPAGPCPAVRRQLPPPAKRLHVWIPLHPELGSRFADICRGPS